MVRAWKDHSHDCGKPTGVCINSVSETDLLYECTLSKSNAIFVSVEMTLADRNLLCDVYGYEVVR